MVHYSYDDECEKLAKYFLQDHQPTEADIKDLAQHIQDAIETWLSDFASIA